MAFCTCRSKPPPEESHSDSEITPEREEILLSNYNGNIGTYEHVRQRSIEKKNEESMDYGKRKMKEVTQYYIDHCTLHGFHYVFETKSILRKIVWLSILVLAGGFFFKEVKTSITQYFRYPFSITSTVEYPKHMTFPAITICDFHDARKSFVETSSISGEKGKMDYTPSRKLEEMLPESLKRFNNTLISCSLRRGVSSRNSIPFSVNDFDVFYSAKGRTCFTLNGGKNNISPLTTDNVGPNYGIEFILNVQQPWYSDDVRESGFRFVLHQQKDLPLTREGFRVSPGYVTYVDLKLEKVKNLKYPFSANCDGKELKLFSKYSRSNCYLESLSNYIVSKCNCCSWFMPGISNTSSCSVQESLDCMWPAWEEFDNDYNYTCPVNCEELWYGPRLSSALFLPQKLLPMKDKYAYLLKAQGMPKDPKGALEFIMEHYAVVSLYFGELRLDTVEQKQSYCFYRLIGDAGGQLGLVLGASFITLVEILDLAVIWFYFWLKQKTKRKPLIRREP